MASQSQPQSPTRGSSSDLQRRVSRKLKKTRRDHDHLEIPERLREDDEPTGDDEQTSQGPPLFMNMNQSIFGLIAAAGSKVDFNERFAENSSDDEEDGQRAKDGLRDEDLSQTTILQPPKRDKSQKGGHRRRISGHKLLKSLPNLPKLRSKSKSSPAKLPPQPEEEEEEEQEEESDGHDQRAAAEGSGSSRLSSPPPPAIKLPRGHTTALDRKPPVMSRMLEAKAEMESRPSFDFGHQDLSQSSMLPSKDATPLARRLMEIFELDEPEQVLGEYPCWLLQTVLLQGYLYITAKHICFYAYLPKKAVGLPHSNVTISLRTRV